MTGIEYGQVGFTRAYVTEQLAPMGAGVIIEADHACMQARGPRSPATTITSQFRGELQARSGEFLALAGVGDGG